MSKDKLGDALVDAQVVCKPEPRFVPGHKSEFALREFATLPGELTLSAVRDIKSARYLWRAKGAERLANTGGTTTNVHSGQLGTLYFVFTPFIS